MNIFHKGISLEMSQMGWQGSLRVAGLYFAGVIIGCLGSTVYSRKLYLVGASGAIYALIFAHLGNSSCEYASMSRN